MLPRFRNALFGVGALLVIIGIAVGFMAGGEIEQANDISTALSAGVTSSFFAVFAGVLIGIGTVLLCAGLLVAAEPRPLRVGVPFALSVACAIAAAALSQPAAFGFPSLLALIALMAAAGAFLLIAVAFSLSDLIGKHFAPKR